MYTHILHAFMAFICAWHLHVSFSNLSSIFFLKKLDQKRMSIFFIFRLIMYYSINCYRLLCYVLARFFFGINTNHITHAYVDKRTRIQPLNFALHSPLIQVTEIRSVKNWINIL